MSPLLQILWLCLLLFSLLLLVGCRTTMISTPTFASETPPPVTLAVGSFPIPMTDTVTIPNQPTRTNWMATLLGTPPLGSPPQGIASATCYEQPTKTVTCLGRLDNPTSETWEHITMRVRLGDEEQYVQIEQKSVNPNTFAPFRAQFSNLSLSNLLNLQIFSSRKSKANVSPLSLENEFGKYNPRNIGYGVYSFSATVTNSSKISITHPRLIITVLDDNEQVVGYRIIDVADKIDSQERIAVETQIIPQIVAEHLHHIVTLEGSEPVNQ